jgi:RimJ/RimL family protein N-acetyltransferase
MLGRYCRLEPLEPERHAAALHAAYRVDVAGLGWTYLPYGPFPDERTFFGWLEEVAEQDDPLFFAIVPRDEGLRVAASPLDGARAAGVASYLRIAPAVGSIEVGHIHYAPVLQRTRAATEAMYLMMRRVFDELGYRRCEWKCDALNAASRRAAHRLGFTYEGTHRQATIYKGRSRDTAWYSMLDREWPAVRAAFEAWLDPSNFDETGRQRRPLRACS